MKINKDTILNVAIIFACIPTMLFLTWCKLPVCLAGIALICMACYSTLKKKCLGGGNRYVYIRKGVLGYIIIFTLLISFFSGVGGWFPQKGDNIARNPIFYDLITRDWPVVYPEMNTGLTYYIGYWLFPALIGKAFGQSFFIGNLALTIVTAVNLMVVSLMIISWIECDNWKIQALVPTILIIFSGINFFGNIVSYIYGDEKAGLYGGSQEIYTSIRGVYYVGNYLQIRQTFNHFIPTLLIVCIYMYLRDRRSYLFLAMLLFLGSPWGVWGITVLMIVDAAYSIVCEIMKEKCGRGEIWRVLYQKIKGLFSVANICAIPLVLLIYIYYKSSNQSIGLVFKKNSTWFDGTVSNAVQCIVIMLAEYLALWLLLYRKWRKEILYWCAGICLIMTPFLFMGMTEVMLKTTTVWLLVLMLLFIKSFQLEYLQKSDMLLVLSGYIALCLVNFALETSSSLKLIQAWRTTVIRKNSVETLADCRNTNSFRFINNYIGRNPGFDLFYSKLGRGDFTGIEKLDIILDRKMNVQKVVFTDAHIEYVSSLLGIDRTELLTGAEKQGQLYCITFKDARELDQVVAAPPDFSEDGWISAKDLYDAYEVNKLPANNPYFVDVGVENLSDRAIYPFEYTGKSLGIRYGFFDKKGKLVGEMAEKEINCILMPGEDTELSVALTNSPKKAGTWIFKMWMYQEESCESEVMLEKEITFK